MRALNEGREKEPTGGMVTLHFQEILELFFVENRRIWKRRSKVRHSTLSYDFNSVY